MVRHSRRTVSFQYSNSTCDLACDCCFGPGPSNCLNCGGGYFFNGVKCIQCDSSCLTCSGTRAYDCLRCSSGKFLQQDNNTCTTDCNPPYIQDGLGDFKVCKSPCKSSEKIAYNTAGQVVCQEVPYEDPSTKKIASSVEVLQLANTFISRALLLVSPQSSILLLSGCLVDMLKYIRYMDINYSVKLLNLFSMRGIFEMMTDRFPSVNNVVVSKFTNNPLPSRFEEYSEQSSFIANSWQWLATLALIMIILISNYLLFQINSEFIKTVSTKIKGILQWNYCISTFVSYFGNLVFYSSLEFLTISYHKSGLEILSSTLCTLISITALIFFIKVVTIIYEARKSSILSQGLRQGTAPAHHSYHEKYGIIFEGFKTNSWLQQSYFVIYLIRISIFNMVIVYLYAYPISQGIIISTLSLLMLLYLMFTSPLKGKLDLVQTGIQEVILFIVNICVTLLALLDHGRIKDGDGKMRTNVEDIIFWSNIIFIFLVLIYSLIIMGQQICMAYKKLLAWYRRKKITAIQREEGVGTSMQIQDKPSLNNAPIKDRLDSSALEKSQAYFGLLSSSSMRQDIRIGYPYNLGETKANNNSLNRFLSFDHTNTPTFGFNKDPSKIKSANLLHLQDLENTKKRGLGQFNQKKFEQNVSAVNSDIERRDEGLKMSKARNMTRKDISIHPEPNQGGIRNSGPSESYKQQQAQESGLIKNKEIAYEVKANQNQEEYEATLTSHNYSESDALSAPQAELCTIGRTQQHFELALVGPRDVQKEESPELNVISGGLTNEDRDRIGNLNQTNYHEDLNARQQDERPHNNFKLKMLLEPRSEASAIEGLQDSPEIKRDVTMNKQDKLRNYFSFLNDEALQRVPEDEGIM